MAKSNTNTTKLYVGKIFTLKDTHRVPWTSHNELPRNVKSSADRAIIRRLIEEDPRRNEDNYYSLKGRNGVPYDNGKMVREDVGERVLVLDETTKRVKIMTHRGKAIWISKFYLKTEIREEVKGNPVGELTKVITELSNIEKTVSDEKISDKLRKIIRRVRVVSENLEDNKN